MAKVVLSSPGDRLEVSRVLERTPVRLCSMEVMLNGERGTGTSQVYDANVNVSEPVVRAHRILSAKTGSLAGIGISPRPGGNNNRIACQIIRVDERNLLAFS